MGMDGWGGGLGGGRLGRVTLGAVRLDCGAYGGAYSRCY